MSLHPIFKLREKHTSALLELLDEVILGTNGAQYRHLDTAEKIEECDNPLHLSMERNENIIGNITFCRRHEDWYIRYFAFSARFQSGGKRKNDATKSNLLKSELNTFFNNAFRGIYANTEVNSFYAYIDPNNKKSLWMSETFGFETVGQIATQTFSRVRPKRSMRLEKLSEWEEVKSFVQNTFKNYAYYFDSQTRKPPFYVLKDENDEILALTKITSAKWQIKRLPGRFGGALVSLIPFIPGLRKIIRPSQHTFLVPEAVIAKNNSSELIDELFAGILHLEKQHLLIWWTDEKDSLYQSIRNDVKWGILNKMIGVNRANVVRKCNPKLKKINLNTPVYTSGIDFI